LLLVFVTTLGLALVADSVVTIAQSKRAAQTLVAQSLCDAGIEKALWELNESGGTYVGETGISFATGSLDIAISGSGDVRDVYATAYVPADNPKVERTIRSKIVVEQSEAEVSFNYAVQVGDGGLTMYSNAKVHGNTYSNGDIQGYGNSRIFNDAYAVGTISSPDPQIDGSTNPGADPMPMPEFDPDFWKEKANDNNDPHVGDYILNSGSHTLGPKKIEGDFTMNSNSSLTLEGPIHVTGDFTMNSNNDIYLDESFGSAGTVIIVDGVITLNSNANIHTTTADPKGFILLASLDTTDSAIVLNSNATGGVYYAVNGGAQLYSNAEIVAITAQQLTLNANAELFYDSGLASSIFSGGPGGFWTIHEWQIDYSY
jgi:hypothetical protein